MTYDQLKVLQPADLYALLERTLHACQQDIVFPIQSVKLPEPLLCLIGDFEIRARFHTPPLPDATDYILSHPGEFDGWAVARAVATKLLDACAPTPTPKQHAPKECPECLYNELLRAVVRKFPGESRHEAALRYIRESEVRATPGPDSSCTNSVACTPTPTRAASPPTESH